MMRGISQIAVSICPAAVRAGLAVLGLALAATAGAADQDGDGIPDDQDNCPRVANPAQLNSDVLSAGDVCQCADVDDSLSVDVADVVRIRRHAAGLPPTGAFDVGRCAVAPGPRGCGTDDAERVRRWLAGQLPDLVNACPAAGIDLDPDVNDDGIVNVLDGSFVGSCVGEDPLVNCPCRPADIDGDGDIDTADLQLVSAFFEQTGFPTGVPDPDAPVVTVSAPADGALVNQTPIALAFTLSGPGSPVQVNGVDLLPLPGDPLAFATDVALVEGQNAIQIRATGAACAVGAADLNVTLDTVPPVVAIISPVDGAIFTAGFIEVTGTLDDPDAVVALNGAPVAQTGGDWTAVDVPLAFGPNPLVATAVDPAGNVAVAAGISVSREAVLGSIELTPAGSRLTELGINQPHAVTGHLSDGSAIDLTASSTGTTYATSSGFVASIDTEGVATAIANGATTITATNGGLSDTAELVVEVGVTLESLELAPEFFTLFGGGSLRPLSVRGFFSDGTDRDLTGAATGTTYLSSDPNVADVSPDGIVSARTPGDAVIVASNEGLSDDTPFAVVIPQGDGFVRGRAFDDTRGLPLEGVTATLLQDGSGPLANPVPVVADSHGEYLRAGAEGPGRVRISKDGFTSVERVGDIPAQTARRLLDVRLTPLDPAMTTISSAAGGTARDSRGLAQIDFFPGSVPTDTDIRLTPISNQGLADVLPPGWSSIAALQIDPPGIAFGAPALLRVANDAVLPAAADVAAVFFDDQAHAWVVRSVGQVTADRREVIVELPISGQLALVFPDTVTPPPSPLLGAALSGLDPVTFPASPTAASDVLPATTPADAGARAVGRIALSGVADLPSGSALEADVMETFNLFDGRRVVPQPYRQDLLAYRLPRVLDDTELGTDFPITPSRAYTIQELSLGRIDIDVVAPRSRVGGVVVGADGGAVGDPAGSLLEIPAGALGGESIADLFELDAIAEAASVPAGFELLAAVEVDLVGAELARSATLSIARPANVADGDQVIVARRFRDLDGVPHLSIIALGALEPTRIRSDDAVGGEPLDGVTTGGDYLFLLAATPVAFVVGTVETTGGGLPQVDVLVDTDTAPFADLTDAAGAFAVAGAPGDTQLAAVLQSTGDAAGALVNLAAPGEVANVDLPLAIVGPFVLSVSPDADATGVALDTSIEVGFSEPVAAESLTSSSFSLSASGGGPLDAAIRVSPDGLRAILTPTLPLESNAVHTLALTADARDLAGNLMAPFSTSFTTLDTSFVRDVTGLISADAPDAGGVITVSGGPGVAEAGSAVAVINNTTGVIVTEVAQSDGSFVLRIAGGTADLLSVNVRTAGGSDTDVQIAAFQNPDGSVTLGDLGGRVTVDGPLGPITLDIPAGALEGQATVKLIPLDETAAVAKLTELGLDMPDPSFGAVFGGALEIEAGDAEASQRLDLRVPLPQAVLDLATAAGRSVDEIQGTLVRVEPFEEEDGEVQIGFREIDSLKVIDGMLDTSTFPFAGVGGPFGGFYIFFPFPQVFVSYINGRVFIADVPSDPDLVLPPTDVACPSTIEAVAATQMCRAGGAIVKAFAPLVTGAPQFYSVVDPFGHYSGTAGIAQSEVVSVSAKRIDSFPGAASVRSFIALAPIPDIILRRRPPPPDKTDPIVRLLSSAIVIPLGSSVQLTVLVSDNDNTVENQDALEQSLMINVLMDPGGAVPPGSITEDPVTGRFVAAWTPDQQGDYRFEAVATDRSGNSGSFELALSVGDPPAPPGENPIPGDPNDPVPPFVLSVDPPDNAEGVAYDTDVTLEFSEPIDLLATTVSSAGLPLFIQVSGPDGPLGGSLHLSPDQTILRFRPSGGLVPGASYEIQAKTGITDLAENNLDQDRLTGDTDDPFVSEFTALPEGPLTAISGATPISGNAIGFSIKESRDSTVLGNTLFFTDADNSQRDGRVLVADISDPAEWEIISEIFTFGQPRALALVRDFTYRGLNGLPTFPPSRGLLGEPASEPGAMLFVLVFKRAALGTGLDGTFLQFYDVSDPANPQQIGSNQRVSFNHIGTRIAVAGGRAFIKLVDAPNPGFAVVDLGLALTKATLLPFSGIIGPDGMPGPGTSLGLIDADGSTNSERDFLGVDANADGDFGDVNDELPDINRNTDVVVGRLLTPGDGTDFAVSEDGYSLFIADGFPLDRNGAVDTEPSTGNQGPYYGTGAVGPGGALTADASGGLVIANMNPLVEFPLLDTVPQDGLDDRIESRINAPEDDTPTGSTRIHYIPAIEITERVNREVDNEEVVEERQTVRDLIFLSNAFDGTVTAIDVFDRRNPLRLAVVKMPPGQPVELAHRGSSLFVDMAQSGTVEIDLDRLVFSDETQSPPVLISLDPALFDDDGDGIDDRIAAVLDGVVGNGAFTATGHTYGGTRRDEQIHRFALPTLEIVRLDGTAQDLADFNPSQPGDRDNEDLLEKLVPVAVLEPGLLHDPNAVGGLPLGDRADPNHVYFIRTMLPADAGDTGMIPLTLESLNYAGSVIADGGFAFPPGSFATKDCPSPTDPPMLHRQIANAFIDASSGQRLSELGTTWISDPFFLTRDALAPEDLMPDPNNPHVLWAGTTLRASLAAAAVGSNLPAMYVGAADPEPVLAQANRVADTTLPADFLDSPDPNPSLYSSTGSGESATDVYLHSGEFTLSAIDLAIKGRTLDYAFTRRYESQSHYNGPLGRGWEFTYNKRLVQVSDRAPLDFEVVLVDREPPAEDVVARRGDILRYDGTGRLDLFVLLDGGADPNDPDELLVELGLDNDAAVARHYKAPAGFFEKLLKLTDGTYIVIEPDGMQTRYGVHGELTSLADLNGNRLDFLHDTKGRLRNVVETMGRVIEFGYYKVEDADDEPDFVMGLDEDDPMCVHAGKIARQRDFIDREIVYEYDENNSLRRVVLPKVTQSNDATDRFPSGKELIYEYKPGDNATNPRFSFPMEAMKFPEEAAGSGATRFRNTFMDDGKLEKQSFGPAASHEINFGYAGDMTTVTDRRGSPMDVTHDAEGRAMMFVESGPALGGGLMTEVMYNKEGLPLEVTLPEGNKLIYAYDEANPRRRSQGNSLSFTRENGPRPTGGSSGTLTSQFLDYDFRFNDFQTFIDPGTNRTEYGYDDRGNRLTITRPLSTGILESTTYNKFGQVETIIDGEGNLTRYDYFSENMPSGTVLTPSSAVRDLDLSTGGYLQFETVNEQSGSNPGFSGGPPAGAVTAPAMLRTEFLYGDTPEGRSEIGYAGSPTSVIDTRGVQTEYAINSLNQIFQIRHAIQVFGPFPAGTYPPLVYLERLFWNGNNQIAFREIEHGTAGITRFEFEYDGQDNLKVERVSPGGLNGKPPIETSHEYDENQNRTLTTLPENNKIRYTYDGRDRLKKIIRGADSADESTTERVYDGNNNVIEVIDARGNSNKVEYDGFDRARLMTDRVGNTLEYFYDDNSLRVRELARGPLSGAGGPVDLRDITYGYDDFYRVESVTNQILEGGAAVGAETTQYAYDRASRVVRTLDDNGHQSLHWYDGASRHIASRDQVGNEVVRIYDNGGNVFQTIEREVGVSGTETYTSRAEYDARNRMTLQEDPVGNQNVLAYDAQDNLIQSDDAEGNVVRFVYDLANRMERLIQETDTGDITTAYHWDGNDNLEKVVDAENNETSFSYDALDRLKTTTYADGSSSSSTYDGNGNVEFFTDQNSVTRHSIFDENDRQTSRTVSKTVLGDFDAVSESFEYDGLDRVTLSSDEDSEVRFAYDSLDRIVLESETWNAGIASGGPYDVVKAYDGVGNRQRVDYPGGTTVHYGYDDLDRIETIGTTPAGTEIAQYGYAGPTRIASRAVGNGMNMSVGFDADRRVTSLVHRGPVPAGLARESLWDYRYAWTAEDQRVGEQRIHKGHLVDLFDHDRVFRLTEVRANARLASPSDELDSVGQIAGTALPAGAVEDVSWVRGYQYDQSFNLTAAPVTLTDSTLPSFPEGFGPSATDRNQYDEVTEASVTRSRGHDLNGNNTGARLEQRAAVAPIVTPIGAEVDYDYRNQPIRVRYDNGDEIIYRYDALGRRIMKEVTLGAGPTVYTGFVLDGAREIEERDPTLPDASNLLASYVFGSRIDEVLTMDRGGTRYFYHESTIGSIGGLTDATGSEIEHYRYDAYGEPILEGADYVAPTVINVRNTGGAVEIDFSEALWPFAFDNQVLINGSPVGLTLTSGLVAVPGAPAPVFRATLRAAGSFAAGDPVAVLAAPAGDGIRDLSGNPLVAGFVGVVPAAPPAPPPAPVGVYTGPAVLGASAVGNPFLFQGRRFDAETGLFYFRARYYDPTTGRFLQNDPKGYVDGPNLYLAFGANPTNRIDPMGTDHRWQKWEDIPNNTHVFEIKGNKPSQTVYYSNNPEDWDDKKEFAKTRRLAQEIFDPTYSRPLPTRSKVAESDWDFFWDQVGEDLEPVKKWAEKLSDGADAKVEEVKGRAAKADKGVKDGIRDLSESTGNWASSKCRDQVEDMGGINGKTSSRPGKHPSANRAADICNRVTTESADYVGQKAYEEVKSAGTNKLKKAKKVGGDFVTKQIKKNKIGKTVLEGKEKLEDIQGKVEKGKKVKEVVDEVRKKKTIDQSILEKVKSLFD